MPKNVIDFTVSVPAGATDVYIPVKERCKITGMKVVSNTARGADKACGVYKDTTKLAEVAAMGDVGVVVSGGLEIAANSTVVEADEAIKVSFASGTACVATVLVNVDPFCITQFQS